MLPLDAVNNNNELDNPSELASQLSQLKQTANIDGCVPLFLSSALNFDLIFETSVITLFKNKIRSNFFLKCNDRCLVGFGGTKTR